MTGADGILEALVVGALKAEPVTIGEFCGMLADVELVGDRRVAAESLLPWPDVFVAADPPGLEVRVWGPAGLLVTVWEEYPEVREARLAATLRHPWP